jgi:ATP-dependent Clp protease ATP-binding subunit ClpA
LKKCICDVTAGARERKFNPVIGWDEETCRVISQDQEQPGADR